MKQNVYVVKWIFIAFVRTLRQSGLPVGLERSINYIRAITLIEVTNRSELYYISRATLVSRYQDVSVFDEVFRRFWGATPIDVKPQKRVRFTHPKPESRSVLATLLSKKSSDGEAQELDIVDRTGTTSDEERLLLRDFSEATTDEIDTIKRLINEKNWPVLFRLSQRWIPASTGRHLDFRKTLQRAGRCNGVLVELAKCKRKIKTRPVVLIADISGSMQKYSRILLHFFFSLSRSISGVESFAFGTRLTYLSLALRIRNVDEAIDQAAAQVVDWGGGTRIGESLRMFNRKYAPRLLRRGAIIIIVSDGWERGSPLVLRRQMQYIFRRCHRLIWLNPLLGRSGYQPLVSGIQAVHPFIDDFLPAHNLNSLSELARHLGQLSRYPRPTH